MGREVGGKFKTEGIYAYLWLIHALIWQKLTQHCKANILQLKIHLKRNMVESYICESASGNDCQSVSVCAARAVQLV